MIDLLLQDQNIIIISIVIGQTLGVVISDLFKGFRAERHYNKFKSELKELEQTHQKARNKDIEILNRLVNFEKHDKKKAQKMRKNERHYRAVRPQSNPIKK